MTPDSVVELDVAIAAPPAAVWQAFTTAEISARWLGGFRLVSSWSVGAPFAIVGELAGHAYAETGTVLAASPPTLLQFDHWGPLWRVPDDPDHRAVMTIRLAADGDGTRVSLHHALPAVEAIAPHARMFWSVSLGQLRKLLAPG